MSEKKEKVFYRGAEPNEDGSSPTPQDVSFISKPGEFNVDKKTQTIKSPEKNPQGVSLSDDPQALRDMGLVPFEVNQSTISDDMRIERQGKHEWHYVIAPVEDRAMTVQQADERLANIRAIREHGVPDREGSDQTVEVEQAVAAEPLPASEAQRDEQAVAVEPLAVEQPPSEHQHSSDQPTRTEGERRTALEVAEEFESIALDRDMERCGYGADGDEWKAMPEKLRKEVEKYNSRDEQGKFIEDREKFIERIKTDPERAKEIDGMIEQWHQNVKENDRGNDR
jgi:hypothetical protein